VRGVRVRVRREVRVVVRVEESMLGGVSRTVRAVSVVRVVRAVKEKLMGETRCRLQQQQRRRRRRRRRRRQ
jgi:hypothetical protein